MADLPQELLEKILQKLPYKTQSRFRCVCKFWYFLLTGPPFIPSHLSNFIKHHTYHNSVILSLSFGPSSYGVDDYKLFSLSSDNDSSSSSSVCTSLPRLGLYGDRIRISGHCNGILCLSVGSRDRDIDVILYNPTTKEFKCLPNSVLQVKNSYLYNFNCGMGYDPHSDDYKVVRVWYVASATVIVEQYSLRTDSWRTLDNSNANDFMFRSPGFALFFKGTYYWWASEQGHDYYSSSTKIILGLNMGDKVFRPVSVPDEVDKSEQKHLVVWGESMSLICCYDICGLRLSWIDIWVMDSNNRFGSCDEAHDQVSWTKTHSIEPNGLIKWPEPLVFWKGNELLLETYGGEIMSYNVDTGEIQNLEIMKHSTAQAVNFAATPVKIKGGTYLYLDV